MQARGSSSAPSISIIAALARFLGELHKRGNSRASAARKLAAVRTFGRYLRREGIDRRRSRRRWSATPKREHADAGALVEDEMSTAARDAATRRTPLGRRDRAILELFYASGLRLSELVGLDLDDVNLTARMVRVLGKGGKERIVPFNPTAATALRAWLKDRERSSRHAGHEAAARRGQAAGGRAAREVRRRATGRPSASRCS